MEEDENECESLHMFNGRFRSHLTAVVFASLANDMQCCKQLVGRCFAKSEMLLFVARCATMRLMMHRVGRNHHA